MSVLIASLMYAIFLWPPMALLAVIGWLFGAHALLLVPLAVWLAATAWLSTNAALRHHLRRERFLDALTDAPLDVLDQLARLLGIRRKGLRAL